MKIYRGELEGNFGFGFDSAQPPFRELRSQTFGLCSVTVYTSLLNKLNVTSLRLCLFFLNTHSPKLQTLEGRKMSEGAFHDVNNWTSAESCLLFLRIGESLPVIPALLLLSIVLAQV